MNIVDRIRRSVANGSEDVFLRGEFKRFGSPAHVSRALATLIREGMLVRLGVGVYAKAKLSVLSGEPIPVRPLEVSAPQVLRKLGVPVRPSRLTRAYNEGRSPQMPAGIVINVGSRRINRKLGFKGKGVQYEHA